MKVLISGASIAGPVLAYWLSHRGFDVTVVERAQALRKTGGHAVDLFRPAMDISEQMGVLSRVEAHTTGTTSVTVHRHGGNRPITVDYRKLVAAMSDRHVEIMRDDLSQIYFDASRDHAEYIFDDEITSISCDGDVTFAKGASRRFDIVVGADGLHSGVRRLTFGSDSGHSRFLGAYLAVLSVPKSFAREGDLLTYLGPGRMASIYTADHLDDARTVFLFRTTEPLEYDYRDADQQKMLLRNRFSGMNTEIDHWLSEIDGDGAFYFDAITQLELTSWSRGRVTLVGDAGYCPGPAVGGSTSLAVFGAYVLAGELARAGSDYAAGFAAYEQVMRDPVLRSRSFARTVAKGLVPSTPLGVRAFVGAAHVVEALPSRITRSLAKLNNKGVRLYDSLAAPDYPV